MNLFLIVILVVAGYFALFSWVMARSDNRWSISVMLLVTLLVYAPIVCIGIVTAQYLEELGLMLYGIAIVYCCLYWGWKIYGFVLEKPELRIRILLAMISYMLAVFYITVFMRESGTDNRVQMEAFHWINAEDGETLQHMFLNVVLFVPVGLLYSVLPKKCRKVFVPAISFGLMLSVLIETVQLLFEFGTCDIDDIISNFMGTGRWY